MFTPILRITPLVFFLFIGLKAQSNTLLNRDFWKKKPSLQQIITEINKGNDPSELNRFAFDPMVYALLEKAPMEVLKFLLIQPGNEVNKITHDGRTYIFWAAYKDNLDFMQYLVKQGAITDIVDDHGYSLLNFSAVTGQKNPKLYDFILAQGADISTEKNNDGANALLLLLSHLEKPEMVEYFKQKGGKLTDIDKVGNGAFHYAAKGGNIEMMNWLIDQGIAHNLSDKNGSNAAHFAAEGRRRHNNSLSVFQYLEMKGVSLNKVNQEGNTPLMLYSYNGEDILVFEYLFKKGASPDRANKDGNTALMNATRFNKNEAVVTLVKASKSINTYNQKGETALSIAVENGSLETVILLLKNGAQATIKDKNGNNLLYYLVKSYSAHKPSVFNEKLSILEKNGISLNDIQSNGNTLFHLAAQQNSLALLEKAHQMKLDINAKNQEGLTALHISAMKASNDEDLKFLIAKGADKSINTAFDESAHQLATENELLQEKHINLDFLAN